MDEIKLKTEILKAANAVRTKYRSLKNDLMIEEKETKKRYEPLLGPLEKIIEQTKDIKSERSVEKSRPSFLSKTFKPPKKMKKPKKKNWKKQFRKKSYPYEEEDNELEATQFYDPEEEVFEYKPESNSDPKKSWNDLNEYLQPFGPIVADYIRNKATSDPTKYDERFGVRPDTDDDTWWIGNKQIGFDKEDFIYIEGLQTPIKGTPGLYELLFKKLPNPAIYNSSDKEKYKKILLATNAHKQGYHEFGKIASSHGIKYKAIISQLFQPSSGKGLLPVTDNKIDYIHWNDPNELVERLALLIASEKAGNLGHKAEIASIEEELRESNFIK